MIIERVVAGPYQTNAYLVGCEEQGVAVVIDPAPRSGERLLALAVKKKLKIVAIWLTHSHLDHFGDAALLVKELGIPLFVHKLDAENVRVPGSDGLGVYLDVVGVEPSGYFEGGLEVTVGNQVGRVIHTPGHSPGGICFYFPGEGVLFSGDTLFKGTHGNVSFPGCCMKAMGKSLDQLVLLSGETVVYPGHGISTTIVQERGWICH